LGCVVLKGLEKPVKKEKMEEALFRCLLHSLLQSYFFMPGTASGSIPYRSLKDGTLRSVGMG
jgi:hypothetical protein